MRLSQHRRPSRLLVSGALLVVLLLAGQSVLAAQNLLANPTFAGSLDRLAPPGWTVYGEFEAGNTVTIANTDNPATRALHIIDVDTNGMVGLLQTVPGEASEFYRLTAHVAAVPGANTAGLNLQLRFLPQGERINIDLAPYLAGTTDFVEIEVNGFAPSGTTQVSVYIWTGKVSTPQILVRQMVLTQFDL